MVLFFNVSGNIWFFVDEIFIILGMVSLIGGNINIVFMFLLMDVISFLKVFGVVIVNMVVDVMFLVI